MNNKNKIHPFIQIRILLFFLLNGKKQIDEMQIFLNIKQKSMKFSKIDEQILVFLFDFCRIKRFRVYSKAFG